MEILFYVVPIIVIISGIVTIMMPELAWKMTRLSARSQGLATADEPDPGALTLIRIQGAFAVLFGIVFLVVSASFHADRKKFHEDFQRRWDNPLERREYIGP